MKADFSAVFFVTIWIVSMSAQINAQLYCPPDAPAELDMCRKIYEEGRRRIQVRICGDMLSSAIIYACGFRKRERRNAIAEADEIVLKQQRAKRFLTPFQEPKDGFNIVEECCVEGCVFQELFQFCKRAGF